MDGSSHALPCSPMLSRCSLPSQDGRTQDVVYVYPACHAGRTDGRTCCALSSPVVGLLSSRGAQHDVPVGVTTLKTVHVVRTKCTGGPQQFACFVFFRSIMPWQSLPPFLIMVGAIGVMGGAQYGIHYLFNGETRKIGKDRFDMINKWRDNNIKMQQEASAAASGSGHH